MINVDEYESIRICWITLYVKGDHENYFNSFGVQHSPKDIKKFIDK